VVLVVGGVGLVVLVAVVILVEGGADGRLQESKENRTILI